MAWHFLDNDHRSRLPITALECVEAGCSIDEARDAWRYEVSAVLGDNLLSGMGEWAYWDDDWLVERIERHLETLRRHPRLRRVSPLWPLVHRDWRVIRRVMEDLLALESPEARRIRASDLAILSDYAIGHSRPVRAPDAAELERQRALFAERFLEVVRPVLSWKERRAAPARLREALTTRSHDRNC